MGKTRSRSRARSHGTGTGATADPECRQIQALLERARIRPRKSLGQSFLYDRELLAREVAYAELTGSETVLEIGAGVGNLTALLAAAAGQVMAVEQDRRFAPFLCRLQQRHANLEILLGDALRVELPAFDKVVANLPYTPALPLTFRLLEQRFDRAVLMYQRRLAERLCARVGESRYGRLSIAVGRRAQVELLEIVPPLAFYPPPAVDSALVLLRRTQPRFSVPSEEFFRQLLEGLFAHRDLALDEALQLTTGAPGPPGRGGRKPVRPSSGISSAESGGRDDGARGAAGRQPDLIDVSPARAQKALARVGGRLPQKRVAAVTPREFGRLSWALWEASG